MLLIPGIGARTAWTIRTLVAGGLHHRQLHINYTAGRGVRRWRDQKEPFGAFICGVLKHQRRTRFSASLRDSSACAADVCYQVHPCVDTSGVWGWNPRRKGGKKRTEI